MHEYIVVHQIDKITPLDEHIPLHMTALHWFESSTPQDTLVRQFDSLAKTLQPVKTYTTREDMFGPENDVPVMRLERSPELLDMHLALQGMARQTGAMLEERWVGEANWNPHVTHQPEGRLDVGSAIDAVDLDLIVKGRDGVRRLLSRVVLGSANA